MQIRWQILDFVGGQDCHRPLSRSNREARHHLVLVERRLLGLHIRKCSRFGPGWQLALEEGFPGLFVGVDLCLHLLLTDKGHLELQVAVGRFLFLFFLRLLGLLYRVVEVFEQGFDILGRKQIMEVLVVLHGR